VKILVPIKRVADPDNADRIKITERAVETTGLEWKMNPFDEYALEAALRLTENGKTPKKREGEVIVVTLAPNEADPMLRSALALGADRAVRVEASDDELDGRLVALALESLVKELQPDLVLMGKQAVDGDSNQVGQMLAELLDYPMATFAASIREQAGTGSLLVGREVDGGVLTVRVRLPAVLTVDLRVVAADGVYSALTEPSFRYNEGVRFAALPAIMAAKRKPLEARPLAALVGRTQRSTSYVRFEAPIARGGGVIVKDVQELVERLASEAKVIP
jgi:electron transfer flavoprotein beta subunit